MTATSPFELTPVGPFSLAASTRFLEGFAPAAYDGGSSPELAMAFCVDGHWDPVAVRVHQEGDRVVGTISTADEVAPAVVAAAITQVERRAGTLDAARLRWLPRSQALAELTAIAGIGPFSAELILLRGAGDPDHAPTAEPRLARAIALAYDRAEPPNAAALTELARPWAPYRTWVSLLLRTMLEDETHEIAGRGRASSPP